MLNKLYKKLNIIFSSCIMLIITVILIIVAINRIGTEQSNEYSLFQRMSTLIIYQLEADYQDFESVMKGYEERYDISGVVKDIQENVLYQSRLLSTENMDLLMQKIKRQMQTVQLNNHMSTTQDGVIKLNGILNETYWVIPATVITKDDNIYDLILFYPPESTLELLKEQLPFYIFIWLGALFCVIFTSHFLLKKALSPTEQMLQKQKDFIASASHELKSPLAVILAYSDRINELSMQNSEIQKAMKTVDTETMRMSKLIEDMLLIASSDAKTWTLNKVKTDVDTFLITLYETYEPVCLKHKISLKLDIENINYPAIYTDKERLFQILCIYLDNAISHSKNNDCIQIQAVVLGKKITFSIVDHGNGIAEEDKEHVFERFFCADRSHTDKSHFGLGLSIAAELAGMLNGKAGFKDTKGGGATFFVTLPIK